LSDYDISQRKIMLAKFKQEVEDVERNLVNLLRIKIEELKIEIKELENELTLKDDFIDQLTRDLKLETNKNKDDTEVPILKERKLYFKGKIMYFTRSEASILERLIKSYGRVVTYDSLNISLYGMKEFTSESKTLHVFVYHIRRKFKQAECKLEIQVFQEEGFILTLK